MGGLELMLTCLALNIYKEARGETEKGQQAVAMVTLNRARPHGDVCKVVFADRQFSWTITDVENGVLRKHARPDRNSEAWKKAYQVAQESLFTEDFTGGADHFHAAHVSPSWAGRMKPVGQWGRHKFFRSN